MAWVTDPWGARHEFVAGQHRRPGTFWPGRPLSGFVADDFGLGHVVLIVPDLAEADAFYGDILGFTLSDRVDEEHMKVRFYHCNGRHHSLAVAQVPGKVGLNHLMLEVKSLDDVGTGLDLAKAAGVPVLRGLGRHTNDLMTSFYMLTPSSFQIEYGHGGIVVDDLTWIAATNDRPSLWGHELHRGRPGHPRPASSTTSRRCRHEVCQPRGRAFVHEGRGSGWDLEKESSGRFSSDPMQMWARHGEIREWLDGIDEDDG